MRHFRTLTIVAISIFALTITGCSGGSGGGDAGGSGGGSGSADAVDTTVVATRMSAAGAALVPLIASSAATSLSQKTTYAEDSIFDNFLGENSIYILTDIFGSSEGVAPVTRIRVLLDQAESMLDTMMTYDPDVDCSVSSTLVDDDTIRVAFLGDLSNGDEGDRHFQCVYADDSGTILYGQDSGNVLRGIMMSESSETNEQDTEERGDSSSIYSVFYVTYAEGDSEGTMMAFVDIQYAQATIYEGADGDVAEADDNVLFKSRSRISGVVVFDDDNSVSQGAGDFSVIKYDVSFNEGDPTPYESTTQVIGRGQYADDSYVLFMIETDVIDSDGIFCIQSSESGESTSVVSSENCSAYEDAYAWEDAESPFTLSPAISESFEDNAFYSASDLIASDGSDFTIPTYETSSSGSSGGDAGEENSGITPATCATDCAGWDENSTPSEDCGTCIYNYCTDEAKESEQICVLAEQMS